VEPVLAPPDVLTPLPPMRTFKSVIERMRTLSSSVLIEVTADGTLTMSTQNDIVKVKSTFHGLDLRSVHEQSNKDRAAVTVRLKKLASIVQSKVVDPLTLVAVIVEQSCLVLHVKLQDNAAAITFFVPVVLDSTD